MEVELLTIIYDLKSVTYMLMYKGAEEELLLQCYDCIHRAGEKDPVAQNEISATKLETFYLVLIEKLH